MSLCNPTLRRQTSSSAYPLLLFDYFFLHFVRSTLLVRRLPVFICCRLFVWKRNFLLYQSHDDSLCISSPALFSIFIHELLLSGIQLRSLQKPFKNLRLFLHACILRSKISDKDLLCKKTFRKILTRTVRTRVPRWADTQSRCSTPPVVTTRRVAGSCNKQTMRWWPLKC